MYIPNLLIISGKGTKSGKTSMACRIIRQFSESGITSVKLSPHYHEASPGLILISASDGYSIYEETQRGTGKNTSRMLDAGADRVFLACAWDYPVEEAFALIIKNIPSGTPIICESPSLRNYIEPGVFIIMEREAEDNSEIEELKKLPHLKFRLDELREMEEIPVIFKNGRWYEQK
jgi:hypothetical protein